MIDYKRCYYCNWYEDGGCTNNKEFFTNNNSSNVDDFFEHLYCNTDLSSFVEELDKSDTINRLSDKLLLILKPYLKVGYYKECTEIANKIECEIDKYLSEYINEIFIVNFQSFCGNNAKDKTMEVVPIKDPNNSYCKFYR